MKNKITRLITLLCCISLMTACGKHDDTKDDKCEKVACVNGGTCNEGICECIAGYEGFNCETTSAEKFVGLFEGKIESTGDVNETRHVDVSVVKTASHDVIYLSEISISDEAFKEIVCEITNKYTFNVRGNKVYRDFNRGVQVTDASIDGEGSIDELGINLTLNINMKRTTELNGNKDEQNFKTTITLKRK